MQTVTNMSSNREPRTLVVFDAEFEDDSAWDENDNLLVPGGSSIATLIRDSLCGRGFDCLKIAQHKFYGWRFDVRDGGALLECILQAGDPWLMISQKKRPTLWDSFSSSDSVVLQRLVSSISEILLSDSRFVNVRWFTRKDYEAGNRDDASDDPV
jgi:hypothetical protein